MRVRPRAERVERTERGADDGRRIDDRENVRQAKRREPRLDASSKRRSRACMRPRRARRRPARRRADPLERHPDERDHFLRKMRDDARGHLVGRGGCEHDRRELDESPLRDRPGVHGLGELERRIEPEVLRHEPLERRHRAAAVLAARRGGDRSRADVLAPPQSPVIAPSAGKRTCRPSGASRDS